MKMLNLYAKMRNCEMRKCVNAKCVNAKMRKLRNAKICEMQNAFEKMEDCSLTVF